MDLSFSKEETAFRDEVRTFFRESLDPAVRKKLQEGHHTSKDDLVNWQRTLNKKGWAVPHWPQEYGGTGWSAGAAVHLPGRAAEDPGAAAAAVRRQHGRAGDLHLRQRAAEEALPAAHCESGRLVVPGLLEPGSGSDLASLKTTAKKKGDTYIVNGQKTWTTLAQHADWIFCLCRTDPEAKKQSGISFILIDMKSQGITVRPIQTIDGGVEVNEVFFDDVEVPAENLVGEENKGWDYAKFLLGNERVNIARVGMSKERIRRIKELASSVMAGDKALIEDPQFREKLAATEIELKALELTQMRVVAAEGKNGKGKPDPASSILKIKGSEIQQTLTELLMEVIGPFALPFMPGRRGAERSGRLGLADRADLFQLPQGVDLRRLQRDSAQHHRQSGAGA